MKRFADLTEQEVLALAITNEEEDSRIYRGFAIRHDVRIGVRIVCGDLEQDLVEDLGDRSDVQARRTHRAIGIEQSTTRDVGDRALVRRPPGEPLGVGTIVRIE